MTTVGSVVYLARIDTSRLSTDSKKVEQQVGKAGDASEKAANKGTRSWSTFAKVGLAAVAGAAIAIGSLLVKNVDNAIKRVDTLNNSNRTFSNMGFAAEEVARSMKALENSIIGLPTSLDEAVRGVQLLAGATGDISQAQKIFTAINNGVIGFGGNAEQVSGAVRQLSQDLAGGTITAETWNSLLDNGLGPTLNAIAKQMGITSKELKAGLSDGSISVQSFTDQLLKMDTQGGGGMKSLQKIAKDATGGISTSFDNMNTAITRGIANIINKIGSQNIANVINNIGKFFEEAGKVVGTAIDIMSSAIGQIIVFLKPLIDYIKSNKELWEVLKITLIAIAAVIGGVLLVAIIAVVAIFAVLGFIIQAAVKIVMFLVQAFINLVRWLATVILNVAKFNGTVIQVFTNVYKTITSIFGRLFGFFSSVWNRIISLFRGVGIAIGNAIGGAFRGAINGILRFVVGVINGFINSINGVIGIVDAIPGVDIGRIGRLGVPQLADGGIVSKPTLAMIGEGRESEAVIPLSKLDAMINGGGGNTTSARVEVNINMSGIMTRSKSDERDIAKSLVARLNEELSAKGKTLIGEGNI